MSRPSGSVTYKNVEYGLVIGFIGLSKFLITIQSVALSPIRTVCDSLEQALSLPDLLSLHQSSSTVFQRHTVPFLGSLRQPQQLLTHSALKFSSNSCFHLSLIMSSIICNLYSTISDVL
jgi:hypothetical protein